MKYVKAMRPVMGVFGSLLCLATLRLQAPTFAQTHILCTILLLIAVFCGMSATMVWNDFEDSEHDLKKGKTHAFENRHAYTDLARRLWVVCAFCFGLFPGFEQLAWLQLGVFTFCVVSIYYAMTYQVALLPMITVGLVSATPTLFSLFVPHPRFIGLGIILYIGVALTICAREILKDLEDADIDAGYKKTVPVLWGKDRAKLVAGIVLLGPAVLLLPLTLNSPIILMPVSMGVAGMVVLLCEEPERFGKLSIDLGTVVLLITLFIVPMGSR